MIRTFRYPLYPTRTQEEVLSGWLRACCDLYNGALQERRAAWREQRRSVAASSSAAEGLGVYV
jgi:putative transposase